MRAFSEPCWAVQLGIPVPALGGSVVQMKEPGLACRFFLPAPLVELIGVTSFSNYVFQQSVVSV